MDIQIYQDQDKGPDFWRDMGYYFASRKIRREMPYLIDDDGYTWFLAREAGAVVGFASCHVGKDKTGHLHGIYVEEERRRKGVATALVRARLDWLRQQGCASFHAVASPKSQTVLLAAGFVDTGKKGGYIVMSLEDSHG